MNADDRKQEGEEPMSDVSLEEQGEMVQDFLDGLVEAFDLDGELRSEHIDDEMLEVQIVGDDLGLLIGPKGQTLVAVQELARTVVQRRAEGNPRGRFRIDVGGYRQRRRDALERFTRSVADQVKSSGVQKALEPMNAADRKVVHDTANEIDGVTTTSEGEDPRRRVVILPA
jgi:spoIIIJ-associated protein